MQSTAVGEYALTAATGNGNDAFGYHAGYAITTGALNTAIGEGSLVANVSGSYNMAMGAGSLNQTTGSDNVGVGVNAGNNNKTGSNNIFIGGGAGGNEANAATGTLSNAIAIGSYATVACSNCLVLGGVGSHLNAVGVGTSSPYSALTLWGPDTSAGTSAFVIANSASTTEFNVLDNGNATLAGTLTQNSDQRLKTNIQSLDATSSLALIDALNPVTFNWIDSRKGSTTQLGFIAQQVQPIFPNLVSTTSRDRAHAQRHVEPQLHRPHLPHRRRHPGALGRTHLD